MSLRGVLFAVAVGALTSACADRPVAHSEGPPKMAFVTSSALSGIWGNDPTDIWVVGSEGTIVHGDGETFEEQESPVTETLHDVHGTGPDDVWAAGDAVIVHYDGKQWKKVFEDPDLTFLGVWSNGPNDAWAVGASTMDAAGIIEHWDGTKWNEGEAGATFWDIWGRGDEVWVAGTFQGGGGLVFKGGADKAFDTVGYDGESARGLWGDGTDVWVAPYDGALRHFDGATWEALPPAPQTQLLDVTGTGGKDLWAVGLRGGAFHWDGTAWDSTDLQTDQTIMAVWSAAPNDAWLVGGSGTLLHWDGGTWMR
ncbi:MAG TPA: hypothetical protein VHE30_06135 [Polyangiaceae bacterium]|nr:hypothetical protein [Polyangiaceae bacterium]